MVTTPTRFLGILQREVGSLLPRKLENCWGHVLNEELEAIDTAVAEVCTPDQLAEIRLKLLARPSGLIIGAREDG